MQKAAIDIANGLAAVDDFQGHLFATGHSLGGGLASAASIAGGIQAHTFNAAGLHEHTVNGDEDYATNIARAETLITAYWVDGELLHTAQEIFPTLPDAVGRQHKLPGNYGAVDWEAIADALNLDEDVFVPLRTVESMLGGPIEAHEHPGVIRALLEEHGLWGYED